MKSFMILGSLIGFLIGFGFGLASSSPWPAAFWRGCAAALIAAVLTRGWSRVWYAELRESQEQRRRRNSTAALRAKLNPQ